jgi:hypothetical protein
MRLFDWPIPKKKLKLQRLSNIEDSMERWGRGGCLSLWPKYISEKDFGQNIWDYSEVLLGTPSGDLGNILGT